MTDEHERNNRWIIDKPFRDAHKDIDSNLAGWDYIKKLESEAAQSAEKIARLEAKLAAAELSNTQLRDVLEDFARGQLQVPNFEAYVQATAKSALAQPISTEALDAYVASKLPAWQPIETAPKDGTEIIIHAVRAGGTFIAKWDVDFRGWIVSKGTWISGPSHWMPLPPSPEQKG